jgi:hypothetical protein
MTDDSEPEGNETQGNEAERRNILIVTNKAGQQVALPLDNLTFRGK